jgi:hypothetical protein
MSVDVPASSGTGTASSMRIADLLTLQEGTVALSLMAQTLVELEPWSRNGWKPVSDTEEAVKVPLLKRTN